MQAVATGKRHVVQPRKERRQQCYDVRTSQKMLVMRCVCERWMNTENWWKDAGKYETRSSRKPCSSAILPTRNLTQTGRGSKLGLGGERPATERVQQTAVCDCSVRSVFSKLQCVVQKCTECSADCSVWLCSGHSVFSKLQCVVQQCTECSANCSACLGNFTVAQLWTQRV